MSVLHFRTARQREVYDLIVHWFEHHGHAPSYGQIGRELGMSSRASVLKQVNALVRLGNLVKERNEAGSFILRLSTPVDRIQTPGQCKQHKQIPSDLRWEIWERDNFTCQECGSRRFLAVDHIVPRSAGGLDSRSNLQTLCRSCNSMKGQKVADPAA